MISLKKTIFMIKYTFLKIKTANFKNIFSILFINVS